MTAQFQAIGANTQSAKASTEGGRIEKSGKYVGVFKRAEFIRAKTGTEGFEFEFETQNKESCTFNIYTRKTDGTELRDLSHIHALIAILGVQGVSPTQKTMEKYDFDQKKRVPVACVVGLELMNKPVGVLLEREEYYTEAGVLRHRMVLNCCFQYQTELTATEIIDKKTKSEQLPSLLERVLARDAKPKNQPQGGSYPQQQQPSFDDAPEPIW